MKFLSIQHLVNTNRSKENIGELHANYMLSLWQISDKLEIWGWEQKHNYIVFQDKETKNLWQKRTKIKGLELSRTFQLNFRTLIRPSKIVSRVEFERLLKRVQPNTILGFLINSVPFKVLYLYDIYYKNISRTKHSHKEIVNEMKNYSNNLQVNYLKKKHISLSK